MSTRISAYLGLEIGAFQSGINKANSLVETFKRTLKTGDVGNGLRQMLGAGAVIQAFRAVLDGAQAAREQARELGMELDRGTASVAAYADRWDQLKESIMGAGIAGLSFLTRAGRAMGEAMGTGSSDEDVRAMAQNQKDQIQREKDLAANKARIQREMTTTDEQLAAARRTNALAELDAAGKRAFIEEEINALYEKRAALFPNTLAAKKTELEIERKIAEAAAIKVEAKATPAASAMAPNSSPYGMSVADVAAAGGGSERARAARSALQLEQRGRRAEAAGNFKLAQSFRERAANLVKGEGFGGVGVSVDPIGPAGGAAAAAGSTWDDRYGAEIKARNARMKAVYGSAYARPAATAAGEQQAAEAAAADESSAELAAAAEALKEAATELKTIEVTVDAS